jgi:hypothetical protein
VPNVYALTAHPLAQHALQLAQEEHKTKGFRAVFGVILMFGILCGGVWMLLQSSFGPKQAYLISGTAFWGCWLILSVIWLTGVPGISVLGIPRSTPQYYGPQGEEARWEVAQPGGTPKLQKEFTTFEEGKGKDAFIAIDESATAAAGDKAAAEAAASEQISEEYAVELGVGASDITVPNVVQITGTELARDGGRYKYARVTFGPADVTATDNEPAKALKAKIKAKTITLVLNGGSLATPTYYAIGLFLLLFLAHLGGLVRYELNRVPQPQGAPERIPAGV